MALPNGTDGIFSQIMNMTPESLGRAFTGGAAGNAVPLEETAAFGPDPGHLRMLSYVPEALPPGAPLVVVLHGCTQTAAEYDAGAGWSTLADRFGFALLLPEQKRANNAQGCFNWFQPEDITRGAGEVASVAAMVATMLATHRLDGSRVYVTGLSAGGAMTAALLATYPEVFAGGAIIAGLPFGSASSMPEAFGVMGQGRIRAPQELGDRVRRASPHSGGDWPTVAIWQGSSDTMVNPVNAEELRKQWADVHGVTEAAPEQTTVDGARRRAWRGAGGRVVVETYLVPGLGHATPIDPEARDDDARCGTVGASRFILPAGISSAYRIAESWGLTGQRRTAPPRRPAEPSRKAAPTHMQAPRWQDLLPGGRETLDAVVGRLGDPAALVSRVLRSAGRPGGEGK